MNITDLVTPERVLLDSRCSGKNQLLRELCRRAAGDLDLDPAALLTALRSREELGSTGMGEGIALPHASLRAVPKPYGLFARLAQPIDFNAADAQPVDLVLLLLLPDAGPGKHLNALACAARLLRQEERTTALRQAGDVRALYAALAGAARPEGA